MGSEIQNISKPLISSCLSLLTLSPAQLRSKHYCNILISVTINEPWMTFNMYSWSHVLCTVLKQACLGELYEWGSLKLVQVAPLHALWPLSSVTCVTVQQFAYSYTGGHWVVSIGYYIGSAHGRPCTWRVLIFYKHVPATGIPEAQGIRHKHRFGRHCQTVSQMGVPAWYAFLDLINLSNAEVIHRCTIEQNKVCVTPAIKESASRAFHTAGDALLWLLCMSTPLKKAYSLVCKKRHL